jgi:SAM-dependent methyltransferase
MPTALDTREGRSVMGRYGRVYAKLAGELPDLKPWHSQWLAVRDLHADLEEVLGAQDATARVLDVGCGTQPYRRWLPEGAEYVGLDVAPGPHVDVVAERGKSWPLPDASFDVVLCTQVLEHVDDLELAVREIDRVLKPGGVVVVSVPFSYNEHGAPDDYRRFSRFGLAQVFDAGYSVESLRREGGIGTTLGVLFLNWVDVSLGRRRSTRGLKVLLLPGWLVACGLVNGLARLLDRIDGTGAFYSLVLLVARKE